MQRGFDSCRRQIEPAQHDASGLQAQTLGAREAGYELLSIRIVLDAPSERPGDRAMVAVLERACRLMTELALIIADRKLFCGEKTDS